MLLAVRFYGRAAKIWKSSVPVVRMRQTVLPRVPFFFVLLQYGVVRALWSAVSECCMIRYTFLWKATSL